jgi:uncharacterized protein (TIGR03000 family)
MFRQLFLTGRKAVVAMACLLLIASAASAQQGYFKQLESQGKYGGGSYGRSYFRSRFVSPKYEESWYDGRTYNLQPVVSESFISGTDQRVQIHLQVPNNARVWFDGEKTVQTDSSRDFITPPLPTGIDYSYAVRVEWTENGRKVESTRHILIRAGDRVSLDLRKPTLAQETPEAK